MGYDFYITRSDSMDNIKEHPITWNEWSSVVDADPDLKFEPFGTERREMVQQAIWMYNGEDYDFWGMSLEDGAIALDRPNGPMLLKMIDIARKLAARVIDEEDNEYTEENYADAWCASDD